MSTVSWRRRGRVADFKRSAAAFGFGLRGLQVGLEAGECLFEAGLLLSGGASVLVGGCANLIVQLLYLFIGSGLRNLGKFYRARIILISSHGSTVKCHYIFSRRRLERRRIKCGFSRIGLDRHTQLGWHAQTCRQRPAVR